MLDRTDKNILNELSKNSRITMKELGEKIHLTGQATAARVLKLEEKGVIQGYTIKINDDKVGFPVHTFLTIYTNSIHHHYYLSFVESQAQYVVSNYKISGDGCYLLECKFPSNQVLDEFLTELNKHVNYKLSIVIG